MNFSGESKAIMVAKSRKTLFSGPVRLLRIALAIRYRKEIKVRLKDDMQGNSLPFRYGK